MSDSVIEEFEAAFNSISFNDGARNLERELAQAFDNLLKKFPLMLDLRGSRKPSSSDLYSRLVTVTTFADNNIRLPLELDEWSDRVVWDLLGIVILPRHYSGVMRGARLFFWATRTGNIENLRSICGDECVELAVECRNQLGLIHFSAEQRLLEISVPHGYLIGKKVCAPTVLDAGFPSSGWVPSNDASGFGWTLDLSDCTICKKGLEEVVVEALEFTEEYTVRKIGILPNLLLPETPDLSILESASEERLTTL